MNVAFCAYSSSCTMERPPLTGLTLPFSRRRLSRALFRLTLSASLPERLRSVVVTISDMLGLGDAISRPSCVQGLSEGCLDLLTQCFLRSCRRIAGRCPRDTRRRPLGSRGLLDLFCGPFLRLLVEHLLADFRVEPDGFVVCLFEAPDDLLVEQLSHGRAQCIDVRIILADGFHP